MNVYSTAEQMVQTALQHSAAQGKWVDLVLPTKDDAEQVARELRRRKLTARAMQPFVPNVFSYAGRDEHGVGVGVRIHVGEAPRF